MIASGHDCRIDSTPDGVNLQTSKEGSHGHSGGKGSRERERKREDIHPSTKNSAHLNCKTDFKTIRNIQYRIKNLKIILFHMKTIFKSLMEKLKHEAQKIF